MSQIHSSAGEGGAAITVTQLVAYRASTLQRLPNEWSRVNTLFPVVVDLEERLNDCMCRWNADFPVNIIVDPAKTRAVTPEAGVGTTADAPTEFAQV
jgi:hypothetical protein